DWRHLQLHVRAFPRREQVCFSQGHHCQRQTLSDGPTLRTASRRAIVLNNSRCFVAAGIAIAIAAAGHVTQVSAQATPYRPPAKRVSPAEGFARQKSSLPTPRTADGHPDLTGIWTGGFPSPAGPYTVRRMGTFEPDQATMQRGAAWNKPIYKAEFW